MAKKNIKVNNLNAEAEESADTEQAVNAAAEEIAAEVESAVENEMEAAAASELEALKQALEKAQQEAKENLESWQRERADFSNFKKRMDRDADAAKDRYKADVLKKFLPVLDDLNLAYAHKPEDGEAASWAEGIELIIRKFNALLENDGLKQIELQPGSMFDANLCLAVSSEDSDEYESDTIIEILQNGYRMGDKVIRPAMVRVAK